MRKVVEASVTSPGLAPGFAFYGFGMIAKQRNHPWTQAVTVAGWVTLLLGFVLWPVALIWAYVDVPAPRRGGGAMIVVLLNVYLVILFMLVKLKIVPFNLFWKISPVIVASAAADRAVHPDGLGCAAGPGAGGAQFGGRSCRMSPAR